MTAPAVLIVDDDVDLLDDVRAVLSQHGYSVVVARDGREGFDTLLATNPGPCVVLLDLDMPVMDGWKLLALMRSYARLEKIPVVLISGTSVTPSTSAAFDEVLRKPVSGEMIRQAVERWRARRHHPR